MEMTLFQLLLFTGIVPFVMSASHEYYLIQEVKTWNDARVYCQATHTDLAIIKSSDDMVQLQNEAQRHHFNSEAWIGLYNDINSWRWSFDDEPLVFQHWMVGQPDNNGGNEACAMANVLGWFDKPCNTLNPVLCFDGESLESVKYIYISEQMTWYDAQTYCRQQYTDLAIFQDFAENEAVEGVLTVNTAWIGLYRDSWKWTDDTNMSTLMWRPGQPDGGDKNCGVVTNGQIADASCTDTKPFFCYSTQEITGRKQTISLKIQSNQDVNDPAVKAAILYKIKKKLMEHGMAENTTVKWIEQPSGLVFHKEEHHHNNNDVDNKTKESCDL